MSTEITVNIHSSIRIQSDTAVIRIDPFKIEGEPHDADIIFITHDHYDHYSPEDIQKVSKPDTILATPKNMEQQLSGMNAVLFTPGETGEVRGIPVEAVASYNIMKPFHPKSKGNVGYVMTVDGQRIYVAGDTDSIREIKAVRCDTAIVPIGGLYTMNASEAASVVNEIHPKTAIPVHYGDIVGKASDGGKFKKLVSDGIETILLIK